MIIRILIILNVVAFALLWYWGYLDEVFAKRRKAV